MKAKELRKKSDKELTASLDKEREKLLKFRFNVSAGNIKDVKEASKAKRDIARILTVMNEEK